MFPKNIINIGYRLLCLACYILVIFMVKSPTTLVVLLVFYIILTLFEKSFRNLELIIISLILLWLSYALNFYLIFRMILCLDYGIYFIDTSYYDIDDEEYSMSENEYIRFKKIKKKKKKGSNDIIALYITIHLVLLFISIMVG